MKRFKVSNSQIPRALIDIALEQIRHYVVGLVGLVSDDPKEEPKLLGSGTLIRCSEKIGILTTHHLINEKNNKDFKDSPIIGFVYSEKPKRPTIRKDHLKILELGKPSTPNKYSEEGPDLAVILLPEQETAWITASQSYWVISENRLQHPSVTYNNDSSIVFLTGFPDILTSGLGPQSQFSKTIRYTCSSFYGPIERESSDDIYDYLEVCVEYGNSGDIPSTFRGLSGGGVWKLPLWYDENNKQVKAKDPVLYGVAFYESVVEENRRHIKCHGPQSIYKNVYNALQD